MRAQRYSFDFGKKEKVLNYACQTYQLSRPNKVGTVDVIENIEAEIERLKNS
jgi:hypothetical protein